MRFSNLPERLRFWLAALAFFATWWFADDALSGLARRLGLATDIHHDTPVKRWLLIADRWQEVALTHEDTLHGLLINVLAAVPAWYVTRLVYHGSWRPAFARRERWLLAGWCCAAPLMTLAIHGLDLARATWIEPLGWFGGFAVLAALWATGAVWVRLWGAVMRAAGVPRPGLD